MCFIHAANEMATARSQKPDGSQNTLAKIQRTPNGPRFFDSEDSFQKIDITKQTFASFPIYEHVKSLLSMKFSEIRTLLSAELKKNILYNTCWNEAKNKLGLNKPKVNVTHNQAANMLGFIKESKVNVKHNLPEESKVNVKHNLPEESKVNVKRSLPDECQIAITAYTLDSEVGDTKLFTDFNTKCRDLMKNGTMSESDWKNFPYKSLYALLARSIHEISNNPDVKTTVYYRGMPDRLTALQEGDYLFPKQFLSCSVDESEAQRNLNFGRLSHQDKNKQHVGTLIKFEGSPLAACGVVDLSAFPDEKEILVFPWSTFKVKQVVLGEVTDDVVFESVGSFVKDLPYSGTYVGKGAKIENIIDEPTV